MSVATPATGAKVLTRRLLIGIKRKLHRKDDAKAQKADVAFRAQRKGALERAQYRCIFCGFRSKSSNEVHHLDDNHHNNDPSNLACVCKLCHPYHHVGEVAVRATTQGLEEGHVGFKATNLVRAPEGFSPQDMNHLLRAVAIGLSNEDEAPMARKIFNLLNSPYALEETARAYLPNKEEKVKRLNPADVAAALSELTQDEYEQREPYVRDLRLLYSPTLLKNWGRAYAQENPAFADPASWERLLERQMKVVAPPRNEDESVGVESLADSGTSSDDSDDEYEDDDE